MSDNDNDLQSVKMIDRNTYIQEYSLKVESLDQSLRDIFADSLPEIALENGKMFGLVVRMEVKVYR